MPSQLKETFHLIYLSVSSMPKVEHWYYIAGVAAPFITMIGFGFVVWQIVQNNQLAKSARIQAEGALEAAQFAGKQADAAVDAAKAAKDQVELTKLQVENELESKRIEVLPVIDLEFNVSTGKEYIGSITNSGNGPAFLIDIAVFTPMNQQYGDTIHQSLIGINQHKGIKIFAPPSVPFFDVTISFHNVYMRHYYQKWRVTPSQLIAVLDGPPRLVGQG